MSVIAKMYRQVLFKPSDSNLQRILWRDFPDKKIKHFALRTYETACAPYLAIRSLTQTANENENDFSLACKFIRNDFYVDDLVTGSDNLNEVIQLKINISKLLQQYGFPLHK
ncbi:uncharacterized protein LOC142321255 [Lycorma delicatula]|uniref:uncharacterized protein LOC142321255 n=1 Tax=Lycorma delicatula TaxID=130591 RepID=UPI003F50D843